MRKFVLAAFTAVVLAIPLVSSTPAQADHTLCSNEPSDIDPLHLGVGIDANSGGGIYVCAGNVLVVVRAVGLTVCTNYSFDGDPSNDVCPIVQ